MEPINLLQKFELFSDHWNPRVIGELNGQLIKIAKVKGEFIWHSHTDEDEMFFIVKGKLTILFRDDSIELSEGEMFVVPKGVEHKPVAAAETWIMLFEPISTKHTGDVSHSLTVNEFQKI